ncbi:phospholipid-transporting ATPase ABCA3-like [Littorina saxatilis]|uniref:phospholipid-transporting ATPase ABCA3-like n=1 Tax=Littorina saxatilis TaxID=31220 RepID=UPI0038B5D6E4
MGFVRQVGLGLYKNLLLKKTFILICIIYEFVCPLGFSLYIYYLGTRGNFSTSNVIDGLGVYRISSNTDVCNIHLPSPKPLSIVPSESNTNTTILGFTPKTALTKRLMSRFDKQAAPIPTYWDLTVGFPNMTSLLDFYRTGNLTMWAAVEFQGLEMATQLPLTAHYHIRHSESLPTESTFPSELLQPVEGSKLNERRGNIQYLMSKAFIEEWGGNSSNFSLGLVQLVPSIRRVDPYFMGKLRELVPTGVFYLLIFGLLGVNMVLIVDEKRKKLKEKMEMMGLSSAALWMSWFLTIYVYLVIIMTIPTVSFSLTSSSPDKALFRDLSMSLFWVLLMLYSAALASFWLMMGALVIRTSDAVYFPVLGFWYAMIYTQKVISSWYPGMSRWQKMANCLVFNHALGFSMQIISEYDTANVPLTWAKLNEPLDYVDTLSMLDVWLMLLVDTGIHLLVTWYLDNVAPGHFSLPKPFYFFLTRAHRCGHADSSGARHPGMEDVDRKYFESDPVGLAVGVNIVHLRKEFGQQVTFLLPDNQSAQFPDLFAFLEETKGQLGITDFGASATTLEEVFLKVGESSATGDLKLSSTTRIAVPEEGDGEEASSATSAAVDENFVDPSARQAASRVSMPEEQSSHGDNDVRSDVDNKLGSDVDNVEKSDVNQNSGDVNQEASGVILTTSVVRMKASDVKQKASNVNQNAKAVDVLALSRGYSRLSGFQLSLSQLRGMEVKKAICWWRSPVLSLIQLLLPVVFAVLVYPVARQSLTLVTRIQGSKGEHPPLTLNLDPFCETTVLYGVFDSLGPEPNVTQPGVKPKASARSSLGKLYAGQFGDNQHEAKEVGSYKEMCKLTTGFSVLDFSRKVIVGAAFWTWGNVSEVLAMGLYNPFPLHAMDIATALVLNAVAKERINSSVNIVPVLYPLPDKSPVTLSPSPEQKIAMQGMLGLLAGLLVGLGMSFHAPLFVSSITSERVTGSKHLQRVSGMSPVVFWTGNLLWDLVVCAPTFALVIGVLCLADLNPLSGGLPPAVIIVLFVLYGPAMLGFNYLTHFCFTTALNAMTSLFFLYIASGVFLPLIVFSLFNRIAGDQGMVYLLDAVCSLLLPAYNLITALIKLFSNYENLSLCESADYKQTCLARESPCCKDYGKGCGPKPCLEFTENYWAIEGGVGKYLIYLSVQNVVFLLLTLEIERRWLAWGGCSWPCSKGVAAKGGGAERSGVERDADLAEEWRRIERSDVIKLCKQDRVLLKVSDLSKTYLRVAVDHDGVCGCESTTWRAVERLCVGVAEKECFGLLGQSGAGKSTTLKMLTGEVVMTKGQAFVNGYSVMSQLRQVQRSIGYCPQTDPLIEHMTCYETLAMFGRLRGIPDSHLNDCVASVLEVLELGSHGAKRAGNLSGGMKRKLTTAMSLIGDPSVILLDEPFTGLDPSARRHLWDVLSSVRSGGSTLILTSHSMEECEALCTRVAIMVNGRMKCLGTTQHLKSRFGQGFTLSVRMGLKKNGQLASFNPLVTYVQSHFRSAKCFNSDHLQGYAYIQIPDPHTPLSAVFRALESAKLALNVQDYSVHQTSLQQVFLAFTSDQQRYPQPEQEP